MYIRTTEQFETEYYMRFKNLKNNSLL